MLVLACAEDEGVVITAPDGTRIARVVVVAAYVRGKVRLGFEASREYTIDRDKVHEAKAREAGRLIRRNEGFERERDEARANPTMPAAIVEEFVDGHCRWHAFATRDAAAEFCLEHPDRRKVRLYSPDVPATWHAAPGWEAARGAADGR
jgi:sRNA-binding carbon storage regulator CsrA